MQVYDSMLRSKSNLSEWHVMVGKSLYYSYRFVIRNPVKETGTRNVILIRKIRAIRIIGTDS